MTCTEAAELIYSFAETKPTTLAQREFQEHVRKCPPCVKYIRALGKKASSHFDISCGEIPDVLLEEFSRLMRRQLSGMRGG